MTRREFSLSTLSLLLSCASQQKSGSNDDTSVVSDSTGDSDADVDWATGGTASLAENYPDPFGDTPDSCMMICAMTLGPCYAETKERQDISEGYGGLPTRLSLRILDTNCAPVSGMYVDIWHASIEGLYSGSDASDMCTDGNTEMKSHRYFRGVQKTDSEGKVNFDTCFPGWYSGRAIHIHLQIRSGASEGDGESVTTQLFFEPSLISDIFSNHPDYKDRGQPDTPNTSDKVLGNNDPDPYTLSSARQSDGVLLAWKTIVIRASSSESLCTAPEA